MTPPAPPNPMRPTEPQEERLRVAFVMPGAGVVHRGAEAFVLELCRALPGRGIDPTLLCRGAVDIPHQRIHALPRDAPLIWWPYRNLSFKRKALDTLFLDPINTEWATAALNAWPKLARGRYDLVVMEGGLVGGWIARSLRRRHGTPFVDIAHGLSAKWEGAFARNQPDRTVVFTQTFAGTLAELAPGAPIEVIPHGVDLDLFTPETSPPVRLAGLERPIVLYVGHIDGHKQLDHTIGAMARLGRGTLVALGDGPLQGAMDELAAELLGPDRYLRLQVPRAQLPAWYAHADCCTLASKTEAFGLVYLEALAANTPCVAPDDAVRREVIGEAGTYFPPGDLDAYAESLEQALRRQWHDVPRRRAEGFSFERTADAYARLFRSMVAAS